jgi:phosphoribosylaminoimidazole carboxylase
VRVAVLDPMQPAPAAVAATQTVGSFRDAAAVRAFAANVDVLTVEIEHVDAVRLTHSNLRSDIILTRICYHNQATLQEIEDEGRVRVVPSARTVALIQDKFAQKEHFAAKGVPLAAFCALRSERDVAEAAVRFGFPLVVKSRRLAYDGRGNATARTAEELPAAIAALGGLGCVF